jgi:glutathione peroxidase
LISRAFQTIMSGIGSDPAPTRGVELAASPDAFRAGSLTDSEKRVLVPPLTSIHQEPAMTDRLFAPLLVAFVYAAVAFGVSASDGGKPSSVLEFKVQDIDGKLVDLAKFKGNVLLIVNTASQCGYTPQYKGLEAIYEKYKEQGFSVLAFPANEFGHQEPGSDPEIKQFCTSNYSVTFPLFSRIVVKGEGTHPLYQFLTSKETDPKFAGDIPWNFAKFLVNRKGEVIARFAPADMPEGGKVTKAIEAALAESK